MTLPLGSAPEAARACSSGSAADEQVDVPHTALVVGGCGHPHGGADDDATGADQGGQRAEPVRIDGREVEQDVHRSGDGWLRVVWSGGVLGWGCP